MIQLEQQQQGEFVCGGVVGWLTPTTYIQLAGAASIYFIVIVKLSRQQPFQLLETVDTNV